MPTPIRAMESECLEEAALMFVGNENYVTETHAIQQLGHGMEQHVGPRMNIGVRGVTVGGIDVGFASPRQELDRADDGSILDQEIGQAMIGRCSDILDGGQLPRLEFGRTLDCTQCSSSAEGMSFWQTLDIKQVDHAFVGFALRVPSVLLSC